MRVCRYNLSQGWNRTIGNKFTNQVAQALNGADFIDLSPRPLDTRKKIEISNKLIIPLIFRRVGICGRNSTRCFRGKLNVLLVETEAQPHSTCSVTSVRFESTSQFVFL